MKTITTKNNTIMEQEVEAYLRKKVEALGGFCFKLTAASQRGIPDRLVILPPVGLAALVELKRPKGGQLSEVQKYQITRLRQRGCIVAVTHTKAAVDNFIDELQKGGSTA